MTQTAGKTMDDMTNRLLDAASEAGADVTHDVDPSQDDGGTEADDSDGDDPSLLSASKAGASVEARSAAAPGLIAVPHPRTGKVKMMTQEELVRSHQQAIERGNDANKVRQENATLKKQVTYANQMEADLETIRMKGPGTEEALRRLPTYKKLGVTVEDAEEAIRVWRQSQQSQASNQPLSMDQLPPEVQELHQEAQKNKLAERKRATLAQMNHTLDNDPVVGDILRDDEAPARAQRVRKFAESVLQEKAREAVEARRPLDLGPRLYTEIAQEVRAWMVDVGILSDDGRPTSGPAPRDPRRMTPSLGGAPYGGSTAIHSKNTPPKRPSARDEKAYAKYLLDLMKYESGQ